MKATMAADAELGTSRREVPGEIPATSGAPAAARLAYLLSIYPAVSHTFFLNEIRALRSLGFDIEVASINEPDRARESMSAIESEESKATFYIKSTGTVTAIGMALRVLITKPQVFLRGFLFSLRLGKGEVSSIIHNLFYFVEALLLGEWLRTHNHRHLHIHFCGPVATVGLIASRAWKIPYSLTVHGPDEFFDVEKFYLREKIENAKFILCISNFCRSQLMRCVTPEYWEKMHVVPLGVDPGKFSSDPLRASSQDRVEIVCVGRLVPAKGQLILLQAAARLAATGHNLRVRLIGDGPDRKHLEAFAAEASFEVLFEGAKSHEAVRTFLEHADIFALASFAEGVPVALMEAMAMQVPCVSTRIAGIPELIRDGLDGLLVPASSPEALSEALARLIEDPKLRRSLGLSGAERVKQNYNLDVNIRELSRVLIENISEEV